MTPLPKQNRVIMFAAAAKSLQSCPTLCNPVDGSPPGSPAPGILQARTLEWVAISFSSMKVKSESEVRPLATPWTTAYQAPPSMGFSRQEYWSEVPLPSPVIMFKEGQMIHSKTKRCNSWYLAYWDTDSLFLEDFKSVCLQLLAFCLPSGRAQVKMELVRIKWALCCPETIVCACSVAQLCLTLWDSVNCSPPGSSVHGISQGVAFPLTDDSVTLLVLGMCFGV